MKSNGTGLINNLFQFQTTKSLMYFHIILLCTAGSIFIGCLSALLLWPTWWPPLLKWALLMIPLNLGQRKKFQGSRSGEYWNCSSMTNCSSQSGTAGYSGDCEQMHCYAEVATICPATTLLYSHTLNLLVDWQIDFLVQWQKLIVDNVPHFKEHNHDDFVLLSLASAMSVTLTDGSGSWFKGHTQ